MDFTVGKCFKSLKREFKQEISDYYVTIFSRRAGAPMCIALCVFTIVSFVLLHF